MNSKILVFSFLAVWLILTGCKKEKAVMDEPEAAVKSAAEYEKEAEKEIDKSNMAEELSKMERQISEESAP